jgi:hypothetical protein
LEMIREGKYRFYQNAPYAGIDIGWVPTPNIGADRKLEIFGASPVVVASGSLIQWDTGSTILPVEQ